MQVRRPLATAALTAAALVACSLLAFWHQASVAHARCAAHGELVHVEAEAGLEAAGPIGSDWITPAPAPAAAGDHHDHCQLCPATHGSLGLEKAIDVVAPAPVVEPVDRPPPPVPPASVALVRLAPKTSPPRS